jgi:hypothetical protein
MDTNELKEKLFYLLLDSRLLGISQSQRLANALSAIDELKSLSPEKKLSAFLHNATDILDNPQS